MGNSGKNINSIPLLIQSIPGNTSVVHGIEQAGETYWRNRAIDADSGGAGTMTEKAYLNLIRNAVNTCNRGRGGGMVDLMAFDQVSYELFEQALDDKVRYMSTDKASPGFEKISYKGVDCFWDVYVPDADAGANGGPDVGLTSGSIYMLNSKVMKFYCGKGKDFSPTPFVDGFYNGQDAKVSMTLLYAQLIADSRRNLGVIEDVPAAFS